MLLGSPFLISHSPGLSLEPLNSEFAKVVRHIIAKSLRMGSKRRRNVTRENTASLNYPYPSTIKSSAGFGLTDVSCAGLYLVWKR